MSTHLARLLRFCILGLLFAFPAALAAAPLAGYEIVPLGRGHYNRLDLAVTVDGVKALLILDTGASISVLNDNKFDFILKNPPAHSGHTPVIAHPNHLSAPVGVAKIMQIGGVRAANVPFPLLPRRYFFDQAQEYVTDSERQYDGLLGENILRPFNAVVDCARLGLYLNTDPRRRLDLHNALVAGGWTEIPMTDARGNFAVPCTLAGRAYRLLVDTGAPFSQLDASLVTAAQVEQRDLPISGGLIGYRGSQGRLVLTDSLQIGPYLATKVHLMSASDLKYQIDFSGSAETEGAPLLGLLGGDILAANNAMIDIGNRKLYLRHEKVGH